ncbi:hypothetical protein F4782DRAFT_89556 [Xylaria castorea]|nr:hypothetical protein F4782DRAFT_89556 [Xylaria castorea]
MDPRPRMYIDYVKYQDVRDRGPLFNLAKIELDPNPEHAKEQWRNLCVEQEQKQKIANELWETNKELEVRCYSAETDNAHIREVLASTTRACKSLEADNKWLQVRRKGAEADHENAKEVIRVASQARKELATDNAKLAAEFERVEKAMRDLRQAMTTKEKQLATLTSQKDRDAKYAVRGGELRAGLREFTFLLVKALMAGVFLLVVLFFTYPIVGLMI